MHHISDHEQRTETFQRELLHAVKMIGTVLCDIRNSFYKVNIVPSDIPNPFPLPPTIPVSVLAPPAIEPVVEKICTQESDNILSKRIFDCRFSVRTYNCLHGDGILTVKMLITKSRSELLKIQSFGINSLNEVVYFLESHKLSLAGGNHKRRF